MKSEKITQQEYILHKDKFWREYVWNIDKYCEEILESQRIIKLYEKQNRFNIFNFLNLKYDSNLKYGRLIKNCKKITMISAFFYIIFLCLMLINNKSQIMAIFGIIIIISLAISLILPEIYDKKYDDVKMKHDEKIRRLEIDLNFRRQEKLKRIIMLKNKHQQ